MKKQYRSKITFHPPPYHLHCHSRHRCCEFEYDFYCCEAQRLLNGNSRIVSLICCPLSRGYLRPPKIRVANTMPIIMANMVTNACMSVIESSFVSKPGSDDSANRARAF
jgi:hypothetical protein